MYSLVTLAYPPLLSIVRAQDRDCDFQRYSALIPPKKASAIFYVMNKCDEKSTESNGMIRINRHVLRVVVGAIWHVFAIKAFTGLDYKDSRPPQVANFPKHMCM